VFHTTSLCSPTRAALITGWNHHTAASGSITEMGTGYPGYDTLTSRSVGTIGEILKYKYRVASQQRLGPGKHTVRYEFKYDGDGLGKGGTGTLSVDGQQVAQGRIDHTVRARFSLDETMDFGEDTGTPVVESYATQMPFRFTGTLDRFDIHLDKKQVGAEDERALKRHDRNVAAVRE